MQIENLFTEGFVTVNYPPPLKARVDEAMRSWKSFCELPFEVKDKLSKRDRTHDFGYMHRGGSDTTAPENKELFHVSGCQIEELRALAGFTLDRRALAFIEVLDLLIDETLPLILNFANAVGSLGFPSFKEEVAKSANHWVYRYLHYFGDEQLAYPHADRGGFTLHLHESAAGGEYLTVNDHSWRPWPRLNGEQTIIFPSLGLQYRTRCVLKALCHQVGSTPETVANGRFSMVAFIDHLFGVCFDRNIRQQELKPGYNYKLSFGEFEKYFVPE